MHGASSPRLLFVHVVNSHRLVQARLVSVGHWILPFLLYPVLYPLSFGRNIHDTDDGHGARTLPLALALARCVALGVALGVGVALARTLALALCVARTLTLALCVALDVDVTLCVALDVDVTLTLALALDVDVCVDIDVDVDRGVRMGWGGTVVQVDTTIASVPWRGCSHRRVPRRLDGNTSPTDLAVTWYDASYDSWYNSSYDLSLYV